MSYFKPNGNLDRDALRTRVTQILGEPKVWATLKPHLEAWPEHERNGGTYKTRITPNGLACALPIETLTNIVWQRDAMGTVFADAGWGEGLRRMLRNDPDQARCKPLAYWATTADMEAHHLKTINLPEFKALTAPTTTTDTDEDNMENNVTETNTANLATIINENVTTTLTEVTSGQVTQLLDVQLQSLGLPTVNKLIGDINMRAKVIEALQQQVKEAKADASIAKGLNVTIGNVTVHQVPGMPKLNGMRTEKAATLFGIKGAAAKTYDFDLPVFDWDGPHPDVPAVDPDYIFRPDLLMALCRAIMFNKPIWLTGHTGTGKSTTVEQFCARLGWPNRVLNLDSDISRMEIMGRDGIIAGTNGGGAHTQFIEGILPQALQGPYILTLDEIDFGRPDVMYAIQKVLEGRGLTLAEDGGRHVAPHAMFRIVATANTKGQGDDSGLYQGARIQSAAFLDRFTIWEDVNYLNPDQLASLLSKRVPTLPDELLKKAVQYVGEHQRAFMQREVMTPISPRGAVSVCEAMVAYLAIMKKDMAIDWAIKQTILNRAPQQDAAVLKGLVDRTFK